MRNLTTLIPVLALTACEVHAPHEHADDPLAIAAHAPTLCAEPPEQRSPPPDDPGPPVVDPSSRRGISADARDLGFQLPAVRGAAFQTITSFELDDPTRALTRLDRAAGGVALELRKATSALRISGGRVVLSTKGAAIQDVELVASYSIAAQPTGTRHRIGVTRLAVVDRATGAPIDAYDPELVLTDVAGDCREEALIMYGPLPYGIPALRWPEIEGCTGDRCVSAALAWVHLHHNVWRATQMFALMDGLNEPMRSYAWGRPGINGLGEAADPRTSPSYWFGAYSANRYTAFREGILEYGEIMRNAKIGLTKVRLKCPSYASNPGNVCFNADISGHHWVRGHINLCASAFNRGPTNNVRSLVVHGTLHHEPLHHVFVSVNGVQRMLRDTHTHGHGGSCLNDVDTKAVYGEAAVRHFVTQGSACGHDDKLMRVLDAYAEFVLNVGDRVRTGQMTHWPKWADPTPQAPTCVGGDGCLCLDTPGNEPPDGDFSDAKYCEDNDGLSVCMETTFNASQTVGICTRCEDLRGPGCPCNDVTQPCDQGSCFGDDTGGSPSSIGTCYQDDPPSWACLADCERLLGNGAFCMHDHPEHGRCVPVGTSLPEATNCWDNGGHMDPQELSCTFAPECIVTQDCGELGYPVTFVCGDSLRCVPAP